MISILLLITISANEAKTQEEELMRETNNASHVKQLRIHAKPPRESNGARTPRKRLNGSSRSATCANKQHARLVHTSRRSNSEP
jgi:hypothetical protein